MQLTRPCLQHHVLLTYTMTHKTGNLQIPTNLHTYVVTGIIKFLSMLVFSSYHIVQNSGGYTLTNHLF